MSIRSNTLPMGRDLAPELQDILRRNGMQGHIIRQGDGFALAVQGHDSPLLTYPINQQQMRAMVDWGTNLPTRKPTTPSPQSSPMTSICPEASSMPVMPMAVSPWDCMATVLESVNMDVCLGTDVGFIR